MSHKVFIIHGRDLIARDELVKFIKALGLQHLSFERVAAKLGPAPFVADIVLKGINDAAIVIALFTPEEHAAFFDPETSEYRGVEPGEARWQARPNVIFEAGVALGVARDRTILVTLGSDVQLFSDIGGVHFIPLTASQGKWLLYERIEGIVGALKPVADWERAADFAAVLRRRWRHFDELDELEKRLASCFVGKGDKPLMDVVTKVVVSNRKRDWRRATPRAFVRAIKGAFQDEQLTDESYWWLVVHGFFRFSDIDVWYSEDDPTWKDSVDYAVFADRGLSLIDKIKVVA